MHRRRRLTALAGVVLLMSVVVGVAVVVVYRSGGGPVASAGVETSAPPAPVAPAPKIHGLPADAAVPVPAALATVLAPLVDKPALGTVTGRVSDPRTGAVLWDADSSVPAAPASTAKLLTVAAALLTLKSDEVVHTRVLASAVPGQVVLMGGGDPTLTAAPAGTPGHYPGAARLDDLLTQVRASGVEVSSVVVDTSAYTGDPLAPGWDPIDIGGGSTAPMEPVMLEGARDDPAVEESPRSATPALDVGRVLASRLGVPEQAVTLGKADAGARQLADVTSAPLRMRLEQLLVASDNVLAEAVGREVALARAMPASFTGAAGAVSAVLAAAGFDVSGLTMYDASGLSVQDRAPARLLADVLSQAAGEGPNGVALRPLLSKLPVARASGTLADRFEEPGATAGAGWVRAKTGTLTGVSTLAGLVTDVDGRVLTFALLSNGGNIAGSRPALDAIAAALRDCGCR